MSGLLRHKSRVRRAATLGDNRVSANKGGAVCVTRSGHVVGPILQMLFAHLMNNGWRKLWLSAIEMYDVSSGVRVVRIQDGRD